MGLWFVQVWKWNWQDVYILLLMPNSKCINYSFIDSDYFLNKEKWIRCSKCLREINFSFRVILFWNCTIIITSLWTFIDLLNCIYPFFGMRYYTARRHGRLMSEMWLSCPRVMFYKEKDQISSHPSVWSTVTSSTSSNTVTLWINQMQFSDTDSGTPTTDLETLGGI